MGAQDSVGLTRIVRTLFLSSFDSEDMASLARSSAMMALRSVARTPAALGSTQSSLARFAPLLQARGFADRTGTVKFFSPERGFGFIESQEGDVFVHWTSIESQSGGFKSLADGEQVEFDVETDDKTGKLRAVRVTGPGGAPVQGSQRQSNYEHDQ